MVALDLRPGIRKQDIRFGSNPWQTRGEPDERIAEVIECDLRRAAGPRDSVDTRNSECIGSRLPVTELLSVIPIAIHTKASFGDQAGRKHAIVVDGAAVRALNASAFKSGAAHTARTTIDAIN